MKNFRDWLVEQEGMDGYPQMQQQPADQPQYHVDTGQPATKKWKATKDQILQFWRALEANNPIQVRPVPYEHEGSTYGQDGVRVTGSKEFIASVLARLKEFLNYETPNTKLQVVFRETESQSQSAEKPDHPTYVFYIQVKERGHGGKR